MNGSTYSTVKAAIVTALGEVAALADVDISPAPPADASKVKGTSGTGKAIWIADADGDYDNVVLCGTGRLDLEETYDLTIVIQALALDSDDTQLITDQRVDGMLGEILTVMANDPTWGITAFVYCQTTRGGFRRFAGPVTNTGSYPSRCELDLTVEARISFT